MKKRRKYYFFPLFLGYIIILIHSIIPHCHENSPEAREDFREFHREFCSDAPLHLLVHWVHFFEHPENADESHLKRLVYSSPIILPPQTTLPCLSIENQIFSFSYSVTENPDQRIFFLPLSRRGPPLS